MAQENNNERTPSDFSKTKPIVFYLYDDDALVYIRGF